MAINSRCAKGWKTRVTEVLHVLSLTAFALYTSMKCRLQRADEHLSVLQARLESFRQFDFERTIDDGDAEIVYLVTIQVLPTDYERPVFPDASVMMVSILVGEIIHNLRSCLDYLIYGLAWYDSKCFQKYSQFPTCDSPDRFKRDGLPKLKGLSDEHITRIEELQPYNECEWTRTLARLANQDKHRELIRFSASEKLTLGIGVRIPKPLESETKRSDVIYHRTVTDWPLFLNWVSENMVDVQLKLSGEITFSHGTPVMSTLEILNMQVTNLLSEFSEVFNPKQPVTSRLCAMAPRGN